MSGSGRHRLQAVLAVVMFVAASCGVGTTPEPVSEPALLDEADFETSDLFLLGTTGEGIVYRFLPGQSQLEEIAIDRTPTDRTVLTLAAGYAHRGLYAATWVPTTDTGDVRRIDGGNRVLPVDPEVVACLHTGNSAERPVAVVSFDEREVGSVPTGLSGAWLEVGDSGFTERRTFEPHLFCAIRGHQPPHWAIAYEVDRDPWTVELVITTDEGNKTLNWPGCALLPMDFTTDGNRLAIAAACDEAPKSGLYLVEVPSLKTTSEPLVAGSVGAASWSPSEQLLAFSHQYLDEQGDRLGPPMTVKVLRPSDGAIEVMPVANTSWPAWVLRDDANGASSRS